MSHISKLLNSKAREFVYSCKGEYKQPVTDLSGTYEQTDIFLDSFKQDAISYAKRFNIPEDKLDKFYEKVVNQANNFNWCEAWI